MTDRVSTSAAFAALPPEWPEDLSAAIGDAVATSRRKVVVLDDDPTGTQTVHNVPVLTEWSLESVLAEMTSHHPAFFLLTNSRSLPAAEARALNRTIASNLLAASRRSDRGFVVVSRSDSTLRGHFPDEIEALSQVLGPFDGVLLAPFFATGGRLTIRDVHYLAEGEWLTPVSETPFARDATFGYCNSNLRQWIEERTAGRIPAAAVASIGIETLREGGPEKVTEALTRLGGGRICVMNAATRRDLQVFICGLLQAEDAGKKFLYRAAASFARVRAGISNRPVLTRAELELPDSGGGLVVVGSHVPTTTGQLERLLARGRTANVEFNVRAALSETSHEAEVERAATRLNGALQAGGDAVLYTSREPVVGRDASDCLSISRRVSGAVVEVLERLKARPRYLLAKGGITSSDVLTGPLRVRRALVLGQILPGVPVWRLGGESRWPGLLYVSFPGNLGGPELLMDAVDNLSRPDRSDPVP